jgi:Arc/MetJ-type ribon-helix-helix transcriptional regulator
MDRITLDIRSDLVQALDDAVASGEFASRSEAVEVALLTWERVDPFSPEAVAKLKILMADGVESGPPEPWDTEEILAEAHQRLATKG